MNRKVFENKPIEVDQEFNIDIDDYDYYQTDTLEQFQDDNLQISKLLNPKDPYNLSHCENETCVSTTNEINKLCDECLNLEHKIILMDHYQSKTLLEMTEKISELNTQILKMIDTVENNEGDGLDSLEYPQLTKMENNLLKLLQKVKNKISNIEFDIVSGKKVVYEDLTCTQCKKVDINCVLRPCGHVCLCIDCVKNLLKCPICNNFIEYFDKVFLPNN
jgi:hypothetical protein